MKLRSVATTCCLPRIALIRATPTAFNPFFQVIVSTPHAFERGVGTLQEGRTALERQVTQRRAGCEKLGWARCQTFGAFHCLDISECF